ncbi:MAG: replication-associated recombination protein A [Campylobacterales bacterium]|nr:replication-associated recombination protein A [Campylobacterales bacterium]
MSLTIKYRPQHIDDIVGQDELLSKKSALRILIEKQKMPHAFFWGPAGCGKTTLARVIAKSLDTPFYELNATNFKIADLREILARYKNALQKPLIFIDEVHRLSKNQQETLLPFMESEQAIILGASTQNPYYSLTSAVRSRSYLFALQSINKDALQTLLEKVIRNEKIAIQEDAKEYLVRSSSGDARAMLTLLQSAKEIENPITLQSVKSLRPTAMQGGSIEDSMHYDLISALIKSVRGSDIDAALYYLAALIDGGEESAFIARRLVILASEDIGNANPNAAILASTILNSVEKIGYPEARILLAQLTIYLTSCPKSNSAYNAINEAQGEIKTNGVLNPPHYLTDKSSQYKYPHDFGGWVEQEYKAKKQIFYKTDSVGFEKTLKEWIEKITKK